MRCLDRPSRVGSVFWYAQKVIVRFRKCDVPVLTLGALDYHDPVVVRAFREHVRRTLITLGNLAREG